MTSEIRLKGAPNFRDLGGYHNADGKLVKRRQLYRSEGLHQLTTEDHQVLHDLGVKLICDLRSDYERAKKPTVWPAHMLPKTLIMDVNADIRAENADLYGMLRKDPTENGAHAMMMYVYRYVPEALTKHLGKFFNAVTADGHLPLILHCSAGKDRTGVLSAILLMTLGVPRKTVVDDYMKTHEYRDAVKLKAKVVELMEPIIGKTPSPEMVELMAGVEPIYIDTAIDAIMDQYKTMDAYLHSAGVSSQQIEHFRSHMLE